MTISITFEELKTKKLEGLIGDYQSFDVIELNSSTMKEAIVFLEKVIETKKMTCRIYTAGRSTAIAGSFLGGVTGVLGAVSAVAIATHNLATLNPDYEIAKNKLTGKLTVIAKNTRISEQFRDKKERDKVLSKISELEKRLIAEYEDLEK